MKAGIRRHTVRYHLLAHSKLPNGSRRRCTRRTQRGALTLVVALVVALVVVLAAALVVALVMLRGEIAEVVTVGFVPVIGNVVRNVVRAVLVARGGIVEVATLFAWHLISKLLHDSPKY